MLPAINFVVYNQLPSCPVSREHELQRLMRLRWSDGTYESVQHMWIWPIYCLTSHALGSARISDRLCESSINVVLGEALRALKSYSPLRHFVVAVRADFRPFPYANLEIVQNQAAAARDRIYMPHLPQIGLIKRSQKRKKVRHVAYFGEPKNLWWPQSEVANLTKRLNLEFQVKGQSEWSDYSDVDISIGIRTLDKNKHNNKPPTKLINSWLAEVPFVGGNDSAFSQCGNAGRDYLRVTNCGDLIHSLKQLRDDVGYYNLLVNSGVERSRMYTAENTGSKWISLFETEIFPRYEIWTRESESAKRIRLARLARMFAWEQTPFRYLQRAHFFVSKRW